MSNTQTIRTGRATGTGRQVNEDVSFLLPDTGVDRSLGVIAKLSETVAYDAFTDGGAAVGTYQMVGSVPKGALIVGCKILVPAGFAGDTSAVITVGDGTDVDRYMTGTPSVFATAADGVEAGVPSGDLLLTAENRPTLTVTTAADFTSVSAGSVTVEIYYIDA
jgi:hypothetical protein